MKAIPLALIAAVEFGIYHLTHHIKQLHTIFHMLQALLLSPTKVVI